MPHQPEASEPTLEALVQTLAANVRKLRARANWSTRALAQHCRLDRLTIQRIENGAFPGVSLATIETLARGLGVRTATLLGRRPVALKPTDRWAAEVLPENVVRMREKRKLTQEALSQAADVPRSVIAAIEGRSRNPALATVARLALGLDTTVERLLSESKERDAGSPRGEHRQ
ncbi:MAG TPA: helix-turn-helix transcriptional regulator [Candidatus Paceibacterota bacterium]|nr:helix-turn-helix transcriptional regulator [Candidatus Paceibacterota bacterium]